jgi:hypothetical protein
VAVAALHFLRAVVLAARMVDLAVVLAQEREPLLDLQAMHLVTILVVMDSLLVHIEVPMATLVQVAVVHLVQQPLTVMVFLGSMVLMVVLTPSLEPA